MRAGWEAAASAAAGRGGRGAVRAFYCARLCSSAPPRCRQAPTVADGRPGATGTPHCCCLRCAGAAWRPQAALITAARRRAQASKGAQLTGRGPLRDQASATSTLHAAAGSLAARARRWLRPRGPACQLCAVRACCEPVRTFVLLVTRQQERARQGGAAPEEGRHSKWAATRWSPDLQEVQAETPDSALGAGSCTIHLEALRRVERPRASGAARWRVRSAYAPQVRQHAAAPRDHCISWRALS